MKRKNPFINFLAIIWEYISPFSAIHELYLIAKHYIILRQVMRSLDGNTIIKNINTKDYKFKVDNLGRIYTVINISEELIDKEDTIMVNVMECLRIADKELLKYGLSEIVAPYIKKLYNSDKNTYYVLVVLKPITSFFSFWNSFWEIVKLIIYYFIINYIYVQFFTI